jgi:hypothetical protein
MPDSGDGYVVKQSNLTEGEVAKIRDAQQAGYKINLIEDGPPISKAPQAPVAETKGAILDNVDFESTLI